MNVEEFKSVVAERKRIAIETQDEWDYGIEQCWKKETEILTRDLTKTINFIENECDDEIFCWIGEVFKDVAEITQSKEFVAAIKRRAEKVVDEQERRSVQVDVRYAEDSLFADEWMPHKTEKAPSIDETLLISYGASGVTRTRDPRLRSSIKADFVSSAHSEKPCISTLR